MVCINHQKQKWDYEIAWVDPRSSQGKLRFSSKAENTSINTAGTLLMP